MKFFTRFIVFMFILSFLSAAFAGESVEKKGGWGMAPSPIIAYAPETSMMLGACAVLYYEPENYTEGGSVDSINLAAYYTLKKQYCVSATNNIYFMADMVLLRSSLGISETPSVFYGIGPDNPESMDEDYTVFFVPFNMAVLYRIFGDMYIGPAWDFMNSEMKDTEDGGLLSSGLIAGSRDTRSSGLGATAVFNKTEGGLNPTSGYYAESTFYKYHSAIGSDNNFALGKIDLRSYYPLGPGSLCFQILATSVEGYIPFYYYPSLGGDKTGLRGILADRYKDKRFAMAQAEYRFPLFWRIGMAVFAGAAEVAPGIRDFGKHTKAAGGIGFRGMIDRAQRINLRFDMAYGNDGANMYFQIMEAF